MNRPKILQVYIMRDFHWGDYFCCLSLQVWVSRWNCSCSPATPTCWLSPVATCSSRSATPVRPYNQAHSIRVYHSHRGTCWQWRSH